MVKKPWKANINSLVRARKGVWKGTSYMFFIGHITSIKTFPVKMLKVNPNIDNSI